MIQRHHVEIPTYYVYFMLCQQSKPDLYVKIGHTKRLHQRFRNVSTGTPIPARYFFYADVGCRKKTALLLERELHREFENRKTRGEWFLFSSDSLDDRREINEGRMRVQKRCTLTGITWEKVSVAELDRQARLSKHLFLKSSKGKKVLAKTKLYKRMIAV